MVVMLECMKKGRLARPSRNVLWISVPLLPSAYGPFLLCCFVINYIYESLTFRVISHISYASLCLGSASLFSFLGVQLSNMDHFWHRIRKVLTSISFKVMLPNSKSSGCLFCGPLILSVLIHS